VDVVRDDFSYIRYPHGKFVIENEASALCALMSVISPQRSNTEATVTTPDLETPNDMISKDRTRPAARSQ